MTILAAYVDAQGHGAMACDTGHSSSVLSECATKIHRVGRALVGTTGSALWFRFCREAEPIDEPAHVERFADAWLSWAKARGHGAMEGREFLVNGSFLVLLGARIYRIGPDGGVHTVTEGYAAEGSGCDVAMGVLYAARHRYPGVDARAVVDLAVRAALVHGPGCFGQVVVEGA